MIKINRQMDRQRGSRKNIKYIEEERLRERAQGQMRDVQTERKEVLFIIFVARVSFRALESERERRRAREEKGRRECGTVPGGYAKSKNEGGRSFLSRIRMVRSRLCHV